MSVGDRISTAIATLWLQLSGTINVYVVGSHLGKQENVLIGPAIGSQGHPFHLSHCVQVELQSRRLGGNGTLVPGSELLPSGGV